MTEFVCLLRYFRLGFNSSSNATVFNTPEYIRIGTLGSPTISIVNLYYDYMYVGSKYLHGQVMDDIMARSNSLTNTLLIETVAITACSVVFFLFLWVPYVRQKKLEVTSPVYI